MICMLLRLPQPCANAEFGFELLATSDLEVWTRRFPRRVMRSSLRRAADGKLAERIGPVRLGFSLIATDGRLSMRLDRIRVLGLPWPRRWFPFVWAIEHGADGRFHFDVGARFLRLGLLVAYSGHLELPAAAVGA